MAALPAAREGRAGFHVLKAPGLGRWRKSKPAVGTFATAKPCAGSSRSLYRAEVDFRWYDADGTVVGTARATLGRVPPVRRAAQSHGGPGRDQAAAPGRRGATWCS